MHSKSDSSILIKFWAGVIIDLKLNFAFIIDNNLCNWF